MVPAVAGWLAFACDESADPDMRWDSQTFDAVDDGCSGIVRFDDDDPYSGKKLTVTCAAESCGCAWSGSDAAAEFATFEDPAMCDVWAETWDSDGWDDDHETVKALARACGLEADTSEVSLGCAG